MPKGAVRKKCVDCKRVMTGDRDRMQWCEDCGGEMRAIPYGNRRKARRR
jgi:Zn finger protein HypA/HybF involved in hydrogenase expression